MISIHITESDRATPRLRQVVSGLAPARLAPIAARAGQQAVKEHLYARDAVGNRLGGRRTHYYGQAARATTFEIQGPLVIISVTQIGIRQRFYGGTITPKKAKYLTIPARAEAHGKTAREWGERLVLVRSRGGEPVALALNSKSGPGLVMYWLKKSVTQAADRTVLPEPDTLREQIGTEVGKYLNLLSARTQGAAN